MPTLTEQLREIDRTSPTSRPAMLKRYRQLIELHASGKESPATVQELAACVGSLGLSFSEVEQDSLTMARYLRLQSDKADQKRRGEHLQKLTKDIEALRTRIFDEHRANLQKLSEFGAEVHMAGLRASQAQDAARELPAFIKDHPRLFDSQ